MKSDPFVTFIAGAIIGLVLGAGVVKVFTPVPVLVPEPGRKPVFKLCHDDYAEIQCEKILAEDPFFTATCAMKCMRKCSLAREEDTGGPDPLGVDGP